MEPSSTNKLFVEKLKLKLCVPCILCATLRPYYMDINKGLYTVLCFSGGSKNSLIRFSARMDINLTPKSKGVFVFVWEHMV